MPTDEEEYEFQIESIDDNEYCVSVTWRGRRVVGFFLSTPSRDQAQSLVATLRRQVRAVVTPEVALDIARDFSDPTSLGSDGTTTKRH